MGECGTSNNWIPNTFYTRNILYTLSKMDEEKDEILEQLNKELEEKQKKEDTEKRFDKYLKDRADKQKEEEKRKPREAVFEDKAGKKRRITPKKGRFGETQEYPCPRCGSTDTRNLSEEDTIYKHRGVLYSKMLYCNSCGGRLGVVKE